MPSDKIFIVNDVYNLTIAANMTKKCTAMELNYALKFCMLVFIIQVLTALGFMYEYLDMDNFQQFDWSHTFLRLLMSLLLQQQTSGELS